MFSPRLASGLGLLFLFVSGCVSVGMNQTPTRHATGLQFEAPLSPYEKTSAKDVDGAWRNSKTGSFITFLSECSEASDPTLESVRNEVIRGVTDVQIHRSETTTYQAREALRTVVVGRVDGVSSTVDLLIFKRNGCTYVLNLVALPQSYAPDLPPFDRFIREFKAP